MIGSELPKGWKLTKLGNILCRMTNGLNIEQTDVCSIDSFPISRIETIANEKIDFSRVKYCTPSIDQKQKYLLKDGDILFSHINSDKHLGKTAIYKDIEPLIHGVNLLLLRCNSELYNSGMLNYLLRYYRYIGLFMGIAQRAVNQSSINQKKLSNLDIPLPPLTEQKQIAEKLDKLFDQIETIKEASNKIPELLKNFRQQVLTYAVTGKLTERWRIENEIENEFVSIETDKHRDYNYNIPDTWKLLSFSNVVSIESNLVNPNDYKDYPLIAPDNIESMTGRILSKPTVAEIAPKSFKHYFTKDSLVYSKIRPYLSKIAYVDFDGLCSADMYPLKTKLNIFYLYYYMLSSEFLSFATTAGERIVLPKINQKSLNIIPVPIPSLKEQEEIAKRVHTLFDILDDVERRYNTLCEKLDKLPQALLCKAFKGELI